MIFLSFSRKANPSPPRPRDFPLFPLPFSPKRSPPLCRVRYRPTFSVFFLPVIRECWKFPSFPRFPPFCLTQINETLKIAHFPKKKSRKVLSVREKAVPLHSLSGKRYCWNNMIVNANSWRTGEKKEFFERIYIKQKVVVQEASEKSLG